MLIIANAIDPPIWLSVSKKLQIIVADISKRNGFPLVGLRKPIKYMIKTARYSRLLVRKLMKPRDT